MDSSTVFLVSSDKTIRSFSFSDWFLRPLLRPCRANACERVKGGGPWAWLEQDSPGPKAEGLALPGVHTGWGGGAAGIWRHGISSLALHASHSVIPNTTQRRLEGSPSLMGDM